MPDKEKHTRSCPESWYCNTGVDEDLELEMRGGHCRPIADDVHCMCVLQLKNAPVVMMVLYVIARYDAGMKRGRGG